MIALILAAGQGTRLRPYTNDLPKCLVEFSGVPLLDRQTNALRSAGIEEIVIVGGYQAERIRKRGYDVVVNQDYASTNMVATMFSAWERVGPNRDLLLSYGDILCEPRVVRTLLENTDPVGVTVDRQWRPYWEARMSDPLSDAETLKLDPEGGIVELGKKPTGYGDIEGQYIGLIKVRGDHVPLLRRAYDALDREGEYDGKDFRNMYMTSFLQRLIGLGWKIRAVPVDNGWLEIDTVKDLELYGKMEEDGSLSRFYSPQDTLPLPRAKRNAFCLEQFLERGLFGPDAEATLDRLCKKIDVTQNLRAYYAPDLSRPRGKELLSQAYVPLLVQALLSHAARRRNPKFLNSALKLLDGTPNLPAARFPRALGRQADELLAGLSLPQ